MTIADTGNGASLTFSTFTQSFAIESITVGSQSVEPLEISTLGTTGHKRYIPTDLLETPEGSAVVLFDQKEGLSGAQTTQVLPAPGTTALVTITFPKQVATVAASNQANFAGTCFITSIEYPELVNDTVMKATINWKLDGGGNSPATVATNVPTFTKEA